MDRRIVTLIRDAKSRGPLGTPGYLWTGTFACVTWERPFSGDHPCINPTDIGYDVNWTSNGEHPIHNPCYEIIVPGRTAILFHAANWYQELLGCIAPGMRIMDVVGTYKGMAMNQRGVEESGKALGYLLDDLGRQPFRLVILER